VGPAAASYSLVQLAPSSQGFQCRVCGFAFAPAYATVAPGVTNRVMAAHAALVTALCELEAMTGDRLRLDRATVVDPITNAMPQADEAGPARSRRAHWWARGTALESGGFSGWSWRTG
jgi:hypothetical protein